jgi:starch phosphorylase
MHRSMTGAWRCRSRVRDRIVDPWFAATRGPMPGQHKRVYYLSMEFLIGRLLEDAMVNLRAA